MATLNLSAKYLGGEMGATERLVFEPTWLDTMKAYVHPYWDGLVGGELVSRAATGRLSLEEMRGWMLQMYPVIHAFPKFLAEALIKVEDDYSRTFFIDNIRVERAHATHWVQMAEGFGVPR
jgi:pyrroloquinoline quinone (PQQ) biosynthesis protein C